MTNPVFGGGSAEAYTIDQSLRFNEDDSPYLSWTPGSAGNRRTWTWSGWIKRGNISADIDVFSAYTVSSNRTTGVSYAGSSGVLYFYNMVIIGFLNIYKIFLIFIFG